MNYWVHILHRNSLSETDIDRIVCVAHRTETIVHSATTYTTDICVTSLEGVFGDRIMSHGLLPDLTQVTFIYVVI